MSMHASFVVCRYNVPRYNPFVSEPQSIQRHGGHFCREVQRHGHFCCCRLAAPFLPTPSLSLSLSYHFHSLYIYTLFTHGFCSELYPAYNFQDIMLLVHMSWTCLHFCELEFLVFNYLIGDEIF